MNPVLTEMRLSSVTWVRELEAYSREAVLDIFGLSGAEQGEAAAFLATLMEKRILKKRTAAGEGAEAPEERLTGSGDYAVQLCRAVLLQGASAIFAAKV